MARILHIEDDPNSRLLVRKLLSAVGHEVIDAQSGLDGVRMAEAHPPDLVLVDINIPGLDGYEVTLRMKGMPQLAGVPIVAITAEGDRQTVLAVGCDGFIGKPIQASRFADTVEQYLSGYRESADDTGEIRLRQRSQKIVERLESKVIELSDANERLEQMARLRREFLQNISHELATPLTPVVGYLRLLLNEELGPLTPLQRKCLESVDSSTLRLRSLIDTLLDVSSLETGRMHFYEREYDFAVVVSRALEHVRARAEQAALRIWEDRPTEPLIARGDPEKLERAMVHVLDNAVKFTPRGGEIGISVRREQQLGKDMLLLMVADSGPGIPPEEASRVFDPFYQIDGSATRSHGGMGLGLAFAKRVSVSLGGDMRIASPPTDTVAGRTLQGTAVYLRVASRMPSVTLPRTPR